MNLFGGIGVANILTIPELIDHTSRAISGATMISGLNDIVGQIREAQAAAPDLLSSDYDFSDSFEEQQEKQHDNITNDNITVSGEVPSVSEDPFTSGSYSSRNMDEFLENSTATPNTSVIAPRYEVPGSRTLEEIVLYVWATICALTFPVIIVVLKNVTKLSNQMSELILNDINHHTTSQMRDVHRSLTRQIQGLDMHHIRERIDRLSREVRNYLDETMQSLRPLSALSGKLETIRRSIRENIDTGNHEEQNILDEKLQAIEKGNQSIIHQIQEQTSFYDELLEGISRLEEKLARYIDENTSEANNMAHPRVNHVAIEKLDQRIRTIEKQSQDQGSVKDLALMVEHDNGILESLVQNIAELKEQVDILGTDVTDISWQQSQTQEPHVVDLTEELTTFQTKLDEAIKGLNINNLENRLHSVESQTKGFLETELETMLVHFEKSLTSAEEILESVKQAIYGDTSTVTTLVPNSIMPIMEHINQFQLQLQDLTSKVELLGQDRGSIQERHVSKTSDGSPLREDQRQQGNDHLNLPSTSQEEIIISNVALSPNILTMSGASPKNAGEGNSGYRETASHTTEYEAPRRESL